MALGVPYLSLFRAPAMALPDVEYLALITRSNGLVLGITQVGSLISTAEWLGFEPHGQIDIAVVPGRHALVAAGCRHGVYPGWPRWVPYTVLTIAQYGTKGGLLIRTLKAAGPRRFGTRTNNINLETFRPKVAIHGKQ